MTEFWIYLVKVLQGFEYGSGSKYVRTGKNMASEYARVTQGAE